MSDKIHVTGLKCGAGAVDRVAAWCTGADHQNLYAIESKAQSGFWADFRERPPALRELLAREKSRIPTRDSDRIHRGGGGDLLAGVVHTAPEHAATAHNLL